MYFIRGITFVEEAEMTEVIWRGFGAMGTTLAGDGLGVISVNGIGLSSSALISIFLVASIVQ